MHGFARLLIRLVSIVLVIGAGFMGAKALMRNPCSTPKTFSIVSVDPRFSLSTSTLISYAQASANTWNKAYLANSVLTYKEAGGKIGISLVYDERQRTTIQNERLKQTIDEQRNELSGIKETIESLRTQYTSLEQKIEIDSAVYNAALAKHNKEVTYWNTRGGAPNDTYQRLEREQASLETQRVELNSEITTYNNLAQQIRQYAKDHNQVVEDLNQKIYTLNEQSIREFEEGAYDPNNKTITIYEFSSTSSLQRVLTHELGHALGLDHVDDKEAIMYAINQGKNLTLTRADKDELMHVCREKTLEDVVLFAVSIRDDIAHLVVSSWLGISALRG